MPPRRPAPRLNQKRRTRKDLLTAAARLLRDGRTPSMDEIAEEAMVSRATAYRYFSSIEALLVEAPLDGAVPDPDELFADDDSIDPADRLDRAEAALHEMCYRNEAQLRALLANSLDRAAGDDATPVRQNRRAGLIDTALTPVRSRFTAAQYLRLRAALSLVFGIESMVVFRDVLPLSEKAARRVKSWTIRALVKAALDEARSKR